MLHILSGERVNLSTGNSVKNVSAESKDRCDLLYILVSVQIPRFLTEQNENLPRSTVTMIDLSVLSRSYPRLVRWACWCWDGQAHADFCEGRGKEFAQGLQAKGICNLKRKDESIRQGHWMWGMVWFDMRNQWKHFNEKGEFFSEKHCCWGTWLLRAWLWPLSEV